MEEILLITEGNDGSLPTVVSLGGLLFSSLPFEKQIDCKILPMAGVEFGSGCVELRGPTPVWPQLAVGDNWCAWPSSSAHLES